MTLPEAIISCMRSSSLEVFSSTAARTQPYNWKAKEDGMCTTGFQSERVKN